MSGNMTREQIEAEIRRKEEEERKKAAFMWH